MRACGRAVWLPKELDLKRGCCPFPFSLLVPASFPFSLLGATSFPFFPSPHPLTSYSTLVGLIGNNNRRLGGSPTGKSFRVVPCVRACARSGCLVELDLKSRCHNFPFPLFGAPSFPFPFLGRRAFPFPFPPNILSNFSWGYQ